MISATTGWALLSTSNPSDNSADQLGRTTDGGRTWTLVTPPSAVPGHSLDRRHRGAQGGRPPRRAWIVVSGSRQRPQASDDARVPYPPTLAEVVARVVCATGQRQAAGRHRHRRAACLAAESLGAAMGSNPVRVYRTTDGGLSWSLLAARSARMFEQVPPTEQRRACRSGCDKVGDRFRARPGRSAGSPVPGQRSADLDAVLTSTRWRQRTGHLPVSCAAPGIGVRAGRLRDLGGRQFAAWAACVPGLSEIIRRGHYLLDDCS